MLNGISPFSSPQLPEMIAPSKSIVRLASMRGRKMLLP